MDVNLLMSHNDGIMGVLVKPSTIYYVIAALYFLAMKNLRTYKQWTYSCELAYQGISGDGGYGDGW